MTNKGSMEEKKNMRTEDHEEEEGEEEEEEDCSNCVPIHSQVVKIKREIEKIKHPSLLHQPEMERVLLRAYLRLQRSRSPLGSGLAEPSPDRPISVTLDNRC